MAAPIAPGVPVITSSQPGTSNSSRLLTVQFTFATPVDPTTYGLAFGTVNNPLDPGTLTSAASLFGTVQRGSATISYGVQWYIWAVATANAQTVYSTPLIYTEASNGAPGTPYLLGQEPGTSNFTWAFGADFVEGTPVYNFVYSTTNNPNDPTAVIGPASAIPGSRTITSGPAAPLPFINVTNVYIWGRVTNNGVILNSSLSLVYNTGFVGTPPSGPTSSPAGVNPRTNTQLSASFNTTGVTGTPPLAVNCLVSTSPTGPFNILCLVQTVSPNNYLATTIDDLTPSTTYYFQTTISNNYLPNQSNVSGPWTTTAGPEVNPPVATLVEATQITMRFSVSPSGFNPAVTTAFLRWEAVDTPSNLLANAVATTYLGVINTQPTWEGTVYGLTPGRNYYFQGQYEPVGLSTVTGVVTEQGNLFDFGYMPPRPWATPNPTIVSGVSQPWRQT